MAEVEGAKAISFSPDGSKLLLTEAVMDDGLRSFLLDVSGEQIVIPEGGRERLGPRYIVKWEWSPDGKFMVFFQTPDLAGVVVVVVVKVSE